MKVLLLGVGLQGKAALYDLVRSPLISQVIAADGRIHEAANFLRSLDSEKITPVKLDAEDRSQIVELMHGVDAVVHLLPPRFRFPVAALAVEQGVHFVDASYAPPEFQRLHRLAEPKGVAVLPEFGLDPGIDLVLAGRALADFDQIHHFLSYGAGVPAPEAADNPLRYKVSWSFAGVLRGYDRPARLWLDGRPVDVPAADIFNPDQVHLVEVEGLGPLEAYPNGDAVRYVELLNIGEGLQQAGRYSMRWPGHCAFWKKLKDLGFLSEEPVSVGGVKVVPRQFLHDLLEPQLQYGEGERDAAVVRVDVRGRKNGEEKQVVYQVLDFRDLESGFLAMQRTVGFTVSIGVQMILRGDILKRGVLSPLRDVPADVFLDELQRRGIRVQRMEVTPK